MQHIYKTLSLLILFFIFHSCATFEAQYSKEEEKQNVLPSKDVNNIFYLVGDAGKSPMGGMSDALTAFNTHIKKEGTQEDDYTIFLGDNIYPDGLPKENEQGRKAAENALDGQIMSVEGFNGRTIFIPGNHDWYANGLNGLERQEEYIEEALGKNTFLPEDGCPLKVIEVNDAVNLIIIDSEWYLEDWEDHPTINDECEIKTRERFFLEIEGEIKKSGDKMIVFAMHHPMYTNGTHGGEFSAAKHLYPLQKKIPMPILASLTAQIRAQGGVSIQDRYNERYNKLMKRLRALVVASERLVLVSGHEHTLQYNQDGRVKQIVSGSGAKESYAALSDTGQFTYGGQGFAKLIVYKDGSSWVQYFSAVNGVPKVLYTREIVKRLQNDFDISTLPDSFPQEIDASIYTKEETDKTGFFQFIWGDNYRDVYSRKIKAQVATLDTLYGGLEIVRAGGGHQTKSLRLKHKDGRELNMRALRKSATQYLQTVIFKNNYIKDEYDETVIEDVILDFYTAAHPYAFMVIPDLANAARIFHTNPKIYYIPKHKHMGDFNLEYGGELYMIEERPEENYENERNFGYADDIESTHDIIAKIREDEKYKIDEIQYIRSRLFDMLVGDWDRHQDQWRWAQFDQPNGDQLFKPVPRDRDQVFSNFDGALLDLGRNISSSTKQLQVYDEKLNDIRWMNSAGHKLDLALLQQSGEEVWINQAEKLQKWITDEVIDQAFNSVPKEIQDETLFDIRTKLKGRRGNLVDIAKRYSAYLDELVVLKGTDKDDYITITRIGNKETHVNIARIIDGEKAEVLVDKTYNKDRTKEIWIYGLDDDDVFEVNGKGDNPIYIRIIGGQNNDKYIINEGRAIKVYDHKSKPNTIEKNDGASIKLTDDYNSNLYDFQKFIQKNGLITPSVGFNPDDGFKVGVAFHITKKGFERNPFSQEHRFRGGYYFATNGYELNYDGEFAHFLGDWNFKVGAKITSENFSRNFFGFGNESVNNDETLDFDFNRVKMSIFELDFGLLKNSSFGSDYGLKLMLQGIEVDDTQNRFITDFRPSPDEIFYSRRYFGSFQADYNYHSADDEIATSRGMDFNINAGITTEFKDYKRTFAFTNAHLGFFNALNRNRKLVLKTDVWTQIRFGNDFLFYQAANIGDGAGLRGYRTERYTGKNSLVGRADIRYAFDSFKTKWFPVQIGIFTGGDVGRVWNKGDFSEKWHNDYGGGFWIAAADSIAGTFNFFNGEDGLRFSFGFGLNF